MKLKRSHLIILAVLIFGAGVYWFRGAIFGAIRNRLPMMISVDQGVSKEDIPEESPSPEPAPGEQPATPKEKLKTVATGLDVPWEIAFLPDGSMLVTEREGVLRKVGEGGWTISVPGAHENAEGGLLGLAIHPEFENNHYIYVYVTTKDGGRVQNRVDRYRLEGDKIEGKTTIIQNIPGSEFHDGGRIAFGPDKKLYVSTGDAGDSFNAQDKISLAGKILRLNDDGTVPSDNPFGTAVWTYGHRNPQGLTWDRTGRLWATEHGRSGARSGLDELNLIEKGKNYGWPTIQGDATREGMEMPKVHSGEWSTWAPAGMASVGDSLFFAGLRGEALYQAFLGDANAPPKMTAHFFQEFGRLRAVKVGPDGFLYVGTSNRDGRGTPNEGDDKILRIDPRLFDN